MLRRAASLGSGVWWRGEDAVGACTEGLGSETGDVGGDAEIDRHLGQQAAGGDDEVRDDEPQVVPSPEKKPRLLPPPMPRAAKGAFSMRAERRGGRLILTEVRVEERRSEVFRASRAGGRLRLQFAAERSSSPDGESGAAETSGACNGGTVDLCQVAAGAGQRCLEVGAVMGT